MENKINEKIIKAEIALKEEFEKIDDIGLFNQNKVLNAFRKNQIAPNHFVGSTGYGDGDSGREKLSQLFADVFSAEDALVSPHILCGTHALTIALFGILGKDDTFLSVAGRPYDTLDKVIDGKNIGSLADFGVKYEQVDLKNGELDFGEIERKVREIKPKMVYLQRSKGYAFRKEIDIKTMEKCFNLVKSINKNTIIFVDNCYGEFTEKKEPTEVGADIIVGSLTKNAGGGLAPNGGYIAGKQGLIKKIANRLTSPSLGRAVGSFETGYRLFFEGLFMAPKLVADVLKGKALAREIFSEKYAVLPSKQDVMSDIVLAIKLGDSKKLINLCRTIQHFSPIDSFVDLEPWNMPGYSDKVIMASGSFVEGATLELSCDAPMREPYVAYFQGGLSYYHIKLALNEYLKEN